MAGNSQAERRKVTSSGTSAPSCPYCGQTCKYFKGEGHVPSFYAVTCGDVDCAGKWEQEHPSPTPVTTEPPPPDWTKAGIPALLDHHTPADFAVEIPDKPTSAFLYGPNGTGKSALSATLVKLWAGRPHRCVWTSAYRILSRIKSTFRRGSLASEEDVISALAETPVLCIDDLGAESKSEFGIATIYEIVKERCEAGRPTIITSNLTLTEIDAVEPRLASRLAQFWLVPMKGRDRRLP